MKNLTIYISLLSVIAFFNCENDEISTPIETKTTIQEEVYSSGEADFTNYVAIGSSYTAGYSDSGLFEKGQKVSLPKMLAETFKKAAGGEFIQPLMSDNSGGYIIGGNVSSSNRLVFSLASESPVEVTDNPTTEMTTVIEGPFNNMGVPGAKSFHLLSNGYGDASNLALGAANPYFVRMASTANASVIEDVVSQSPTFFTLWIGNNDVLSFASEGGNGEDHNITNNLDPTTYGPNDITNSNVFASSLDNILSSITENTSRGIVLSVVDVKNAPYFTTVPHNPAELDEANATALNTGYQDYNTALENLVLSSTITEDEKNKRLINFSEGYNSVVIIDEDLTDLTAINPDLGNFRQATQDDFIVLPASSFIGTLADESDPTSINGLAIPLDDKWVLTPEEKTSINNAVAAYNTTIENLCNTYEVKYLDINTLLNEVNTTGKTVTGTTITSEYVTGGAFSLDGIHPSPRGYALVANEIIKTINAEYKSNLPYLREIDYTGLYLD